MYKCNVCMWQAIGGPRPQPNYCWNFESRIILLLQMIFSKKTRLGVRVLWLFFDQKLIYTPRMLFKACIASLLLLCFFTVPAVLILELHIFGIRCFAQSLAELKSWFCKFKSYFANTANLTVFTGTWTLRLVTCYRAQIPCVIVCLSVTFDVRAPYSAYAQYTVYILLSQVQIQMSSVELR